MILHSIALGSAIGVTIGFVILVSMLCVTFILGGFMYSDKKEAYKTIQSVCSGIAVMLIAWTLVIIWWETPSNPWITTASGILFGIGILVLMGILLGGEPEEEEVNT